MLEGWFAQPKPIWERLGHLVASDVHVSVFFNSHSAAFSLYLHAIF